MYLAAAPTSSDRWRVLDGSVKSVSFGQKMGHIIGCPARLICRQPPASVARVGQFLEISPVEVHLDLIARLQVEAGLGDK
jgi:hypothetical protein